MTNEYFTWTQLKTKSIADSLDIKYHDMNGKYQIYLLDGPDACITYLPKQVTLDGDGFIADDKTQLQNDLDDFEDNYKSGAEETEGVKDP